MHYSNNLDYIVNGYHPHKQYSGINYFSKSVDEKYVFDILDIQASHEYRGNPREIMQYGNSHNWLTYHLAEHTPLPQIFLNPSRLKSKFVDDNAESRNIAKKVFWLMTHENLPDDISINIMPFYEFRLRHSGFGLWSDGILGFSINGAAKQIFIRENNLDEMIIVIGHEIGHVLTATLPNKQDEEAKAFAFSIEWAKTIKKHNVANLGLSIKDDFNPARNGLHDMAFGFIESMLKKGRKAINLHNDLAKGYLSVFDIMYL